MSLFLRRPALWPLAARAHLLACRSATSPLASIRTFACSSATTCWYCPRMASISACTACTSVSPACRCTMAHHVITPLHAQRNACWICPCMASISACTACTSVLPACRQPICHTLTCIQKWIYGLLQWKEVFCVHSVPSHSKTPASVFRAKFLMCTPDRVQEQRPQAVILSSHNRLSPLCCSAAHVVRCVMQKGAYTLDHKSFVSCQITCLNRHSSSSEYPTILDTHLLIHQHGPCPQPLMAC